MGSSVCIVGDLVGEHAYCARATFDEFIDFDGVRRWISTCDQKHGEYGSNCRPTLFNPAVLPKIGKRQVDLKVIDVDNMCVVYTPLRCKYIALSYVWGTNRRTRLVLTTHNEETLMQPGALANARNSIPNTILDAITVVRRLGERYLWVDSLCLVQDDAGELEECVAIMDLFYEMACLTIVAADGEDAWSAIQGVAPTPRRTNRRVREIAPGLNMTTTMDMDNLLRRSAYSTRAWTMQEEIISPRLLVFIDGQVYYSCAKSHYSEALNWPGRPLYDQYHSIASLYSSIFTDSVANFNALKSSCCTTSDATYPSRATFFGQLKVCFENSLFSQASIALKDCRHRLIDLCYSKIIWPQQVKSPAGEKAFQASPGQGGSTRPSTKMMT